MADNVPNVGHLCGDGAMRDAIHVCVTPATAGVRLAPGEHVGLEDGRARPVSANIGIVDPFLREDVQEGQAFWLFVYPGTVTSLRHVWLHPAFRPRVPGAGDAS